MLLGHGVEVNAASESGAVPLMWAAGVGAAGCVRALLAAGADPNIRDASGASAVLMAAAAGEP